MKHAQIPIRPQEKWAWSPSFIPGNWRYFGICWLCSGGPVAGVPGPYVRCMRCGLAHYSEGDPGLPIDHLLDRLNPLPKAAGE